MHVRVQDCAHILCMYVCMYVCIPKSKVKSIASLLLQGGSSLAVSFRMSLIAIVLFCVVIVCITGLFLLVPCKALLH